MTSAHTPGPWSQACGNPNGDAVVCAYHLPKYNTLVSLKQGVRGRTPDEALANIRLIAAAPDLLAALRAALPVLIGCERNEDAWGASRPLALARAAVAKAEGGAR